MGVRGVEHPAHVGVRATLDHLADELDAEPAAAVGRQHVDVGEVHHRDAVAGRTAEAGLLTAVVEADHAPRLADELLLDGVRPAGRPVRVLGDEAVDGGDVDPGRVVVQLEAVAEVAPHADSVRSRKPPCSSYDEVTTASASRLARSVRPAATASASGEERSRSTPARPPPESRTEPAACPRHTAPPARAAKPASSTPARCTHA